MRSTTFYLTEHQLASLAHIAAEENRSMAELVREAVDYVLTTHGVQTGKRDADVPLPSDGKRGRPPTLLRRVEALEKKVADLDLSAHDHSEPEKRGVIWSNK